MQRAHRLSRVLFVVASIGIGPSAFAEMVWGADTAPTHEVRDLATGQVLSCSCQMAAGNVVCTVCVAREDPKIEIIGDAGRYTSFWREVISRLKDENTMRSLDELDIRLHDGNLFVLNISCKANPNNRVSFETGLSLPQNQSILTKAIGNAVARACGSVSSDIFQLARNGVLADRNAKIRLSPPPENGSQYWQAALREILADETIVNNVAELVLDPSPMVYFKGDGEPYYRAEIRTLRCVNGGPKKSYRIPMTDVPRNLVNFRRWIRDIVAEACAP